MLDEVRTAGPAWMPPLQTLPPLACTVPAWDNHSWEGCAVAEAIAGSSPSPVSEALISRDLLLPVPVPNSSGGTGEALLYLSGDGCGVIGGDKKGQIPPQSNPRRI